jgi:hypothetical protein
MQGLSSLAGAGNIFHGLESSRAQSVARDHNHEVHEEQECQTMQTRMSRGASF